MDDNTDGSEEYSRMGDLSQENAQLRAENERLRKGNGVMLAGLKQARATMCWADSPDVAEIIDSAIRAAEEG